MKTVGFAADSETQLIIKHDSIYPGVQSMPAKYILSQLKHCSHPNVRVPTLEASLWTRGNR